MYGVSGTGRDQVKQWKDTIVISQRWFIYPNQVNFYANHKFTCASKVKRQNKIGLDQWVHYGMFDDS